MATTKDITSVIPVWPSRPAPEVRRDREHPRDERHKDDKERDDKDDAAGEHGIDEYA